MKIEIDTKDDIHILRHVIQLLHSVSSTSVTKKYNYNDSASSMFNSAPSYPESSPVSAPPVADATPLFNMFDAPSSASGTPSPDSFSSLFPSIEEKKDNEKGDFLDSLEVY